MFLFLLLSLMGCPDNVATRQFGGDMTVNLACDQALINATWKESSLWLLLEPAPDDWQPRKLLFEEKSPYGVVQGKVLIVEQACR